MDSDGHHDLSLLKLSSVRQSSRKSQKQKSVSRKKGPRKPTRTSLYNRHTLDQVPDLFDGVAYNVFDPHGRLAKLARAGTVRRNEDGETDREEDDNVEDTASIDSSESIQRHPPTYAQDQQNTPPEKVPLTTEEMHEHLYPTKKPVYDDTKGSLSVSEKRSSGDNARLSVSTGNLSTIAESNGIGMALEAQPAVISQDEMDKEHMKRANMLTNLILDMKTNLKADHNIIDPAENLPTDQNNGRDNALKKVQISRSTYLRAEKVKSMLAIKYLLLQRTLDWANANEDINPHRNVEGVYNPLQVIRNRKIRDKYKEYPRPISFKELPLASNVFSKHSFRDPAYKMLWSIDLTEFMGDPIWRTYHWNELKDPRGKLWFPPEKHESRDKNSVSGTGSSDNLPTLNRRLYDKLFRAEAESVQLKRSQPSALSVDDMFKPVRSKSSSPVRERLRSKITKKKWRRPSGSVSDDDEDSLKQATKHSSSTPPSVDPNTSDVGPLDNERGEQNGLSPPIIVVNPETPVQVMERSRSSSFLGVNEVAFNPVEKESDKDKDKIKEDEKESSVRKHSEGNSDLGLDAEKHQEKLLGEGIEVEMEDEALKVSGSNPVVEKMISHALQEPLRMHQLEETAQIRSIMESLALIRKVSNIRLHYFYAIYPHLTTSVKTRISNLINNEIFTLHEKSKKIANHDLPAQERMYISFLDQIQDMLHLINDDYSIRVDSLLSTSDRSIGELNTSVSLEVRKVNERLDKLHNQLLGRSIRDSIGVENLKINYRESSGYQVLYTILENSIIVLLRLIWMCVNIYKALYYLVSVVWSIIRFLLGI